VVTGHRKENYVAEIHSGIHTLVADVPQKLGGTDLGPGPHDLLEAALTACTIITLQMYANRQKWNLESADVKVSIDKEGPESHLTREISLKGDLSPEQKARLLEIANKCPIHKLLTSKIEISTQTV
jgi:putative redox protein